MSALPKPLAKFWSNHSSSPERAWIHEADDPHLRRLGSRVRWDLPTSAEGEVDAAMAKGGRVQSGLIPQPFVGNLQSPDVILCLTNPGFGRGDYAAERAKNAFADQKVANLRQWLCNADYPFFEIDPAHAATPAFGWWFPRLAPAIDCIARQSGYTRWEAARVVARRVVCVELFAYHSSTAGGWLDRLVERLPSSLAAQAYVRERAEDGARVVVCRRLDAWRKALAKAADLPNVAYVELMSITFSPHTPGGDALIRGLGYDPRA